MCWFSLFLLCPYWSAAVVLLCGPSLIPIEYMYVSGSSLLWFMCKSKNFAIMFYRVSTKISSCIMVTIFESPKILMQWRLMYFKTSSYCVMYWTNAISCTCTYIASFIYNIRLIISMVVYVKCCNLLFFCCVYVCVSFFREKFLT